MSAKVRTQSDGETWASRARHALTVAAAAATVLPGIARWLGPSLMFHPTRDSAPWAVAQAGPPWQAVTLSSGTDEPLAAHRAHARPIIISGAVRPPLLEAAPWILFFGGNASPISSNLGLANAIRGRADLGVATFSYRGYDDTPGRPSEAALVADARTIAAALQRDYGVNPARLIIIGQSLGSGVASALAHDLAIAGTPASRLVLISPFCSMAARFNDTTWPFPIGWALADTFRSDRRLAVVPSPIRIVHGTADRVISVRHARRLAAQLGPRAEYWELPRADHNDVFEHLEPARLLDPHRAQ